MKMRSWMAWLGLSVVILVVAACAVLTGAKHQADDVQAWAFVGPTVAELTKTLGPGDTLWFKVDAKLGGMVRVNSDGTWLDESRPCPPFTGCN